MIAEKPVWWDYATTGEDGYINGIREDAPEEIKKAYEEYLEEKRKQEEEGILV